MIPNRSLISLSLSLSLVRVYMYVCVCLSRFLVIADGANGDQIPGVEKGTFSLQTRF